MTDHGRGREQKPAPGWAQDSAYLFFQSSPVVLICSVWGMQTAPGSFQKDQLIFKTPCLGVPGGLSH